jgi:hypothetical protein
VETNEPFAVVYLKLWRYEASCCQGSEQALEFYGERFQNHYPTQTIQGCIVITNLKMDSGCIETLRMCRASDGVEFLHVMDFYTLFELGEVSRRILQGHTEVGKAVGERERGWSLLQQMQMPLSPMQMPSYQATEDCERAPL